MAFFGFRSNSLIAVVIKIVSRHNNKDITHSSTVVFLNNTKVLVSNSNTFQVTSNGCLMIPFLCLLHLENWFKHQIWLHFPKDLLFLSKNEKDCSIFFFFSF